MLYMVPKTFYQANSKNKAMTASVYGHNFAAKFHRSEFEIFAVYKLHRSILFLCLLINLKMQIGFF